ncbi:MAG: iron-sulfur cluster repair di-iron protein [Bacteroidota bacterium]
MASLVDENYIYARALNCLGIEFYLHPNKKLGEICLEKGLKKEQVIQSFYLFNKSQQFSFRELQQYPLEFVIEYLKHTHHLFIKDKLPYIVRLLNSYEVENDLKLVFPEFVDEFIEHIYKEEDTVFHYIQHLLTFEKPISPIKAVKHLKFNHLSLADIHAAHEDEDELEGIRNLIEDREDDSIHWKVITSEIKAFDREMWYHAEIENKILFPRAIQLEKRVNELFQEISKLN